MDAVLATTSPDVEYAVQTERATAGSSGIFRVTSLKRRITEASSGSYSDSTLNASGSATSAGAIDGWGASSGEPGMLAVPMPQPLPPVGLAALVAGASDRAAHVETEHKRIIGPGDLARAERRKVFFTDLISHIAAFKEYHNRRRELTRRLATFASRMRMEAQRKAEMRERVEEQRRLRAMKEANKDAYLNLIKQGKEERITYLLEQTETYLAGLGDLVGMLRGVPCRRAYHHETRTDIQIAHAPGLQHTIFSTSPPPRHHGCHHHCRWSNRRRRRASSRSTQSSGASLLRPPLLPKQVRRDGERERGRAKSSAARSIRRNEVDCSPSRSFIARSPPA